MHCIDSFQEGGTELNAVRTVELLARDRFEVVLVALATDGPMRARYERAGIEVQSHPIPSLYSPAALRQAARLVGFLRRWRPDVVHCHDLYTNVFAGACARAAGVPRVILSRRWWSGPSTSLEVANGFAYRHLAHRVLANSESVARRTAEIDRVDPARIVTIPNFLEEDAFEVMAPEARRAMLDDLGVPAGALVVGSVANLRPVKDLPTLVRATAILRERVPDLHLVLVGDGPSRTALLELGQSLGIADRLHLAGRRPNRPNPHALLDISVLCSLREGFPNTIIEAMAVSRPVVATSVGGIVDVVEQDRTGLLVPPGEPDRLADALETLAASPDRRRAFGAAGRARVAERYPAATVLAGLEALYRGQAARRSET